MKISTMQTLVTALSSVPSTPVLDALLDQADARYGALDYDNFYLVRDFLRLNWEGAPGVLLDDGVKWVPVDGGQKDHFLHVSTDDANKVSYTKDEGRGANDVQTRTTSDAYFAKYGRAPSNQDVYTPVTASKADAPAADVKTDAPEKVRQGDTRPPAFISALMDALMQDQGRDDGATAKDVVRAVNKALDILLAVTKG